MYKDNQITYETYDLNTAIAFNNNLLIDTSKYNFSYNSEVKALITSDCVYKQFSSNRNIPITSEYTSIATLYNLNYIHGFHFLFTFITKDLDITKINSNSSLTLAIYINDILTKEYSYFIEPNDVFSVNIYDEFKCNKDISNIIIYAKSSIPCRYDLFANSIGNLNQANQLIIYY